MSSYRPSKYLKITSFDILFVLRITLDGLHSPSLEHDPILGMSPQRGKLQGDEKTLGGFPVKFLILVVSPHPLVTSCVRSVILSR